MTVFGIKAPAKQALIVLAAGWLASGPLGCRAESAFVGRASRDAVNESTIGEVLRRNTDRLMAIPGVVGVAIGKHAGRPSILVLVEKKTDALIEQVPSDLEGFPVVIEETGAFRPLDRTE